MVDVNKKIQDTYSRTFSTQIQEYVISSKTAGDKSHDPSNQRQHQAVTVKNIDSNVRGKSQSADHVTKFLLRNTVLAFSLKSRAKY